MLSQDWVRPNVEEFAGTEDMQFRTTRDYLSTTGDFNGDGQTDEAFMALNHDKDMYGIFVSLSGLPQPIQLVEAPLVQASKIGIASVEPGTYLTACGKGYDIGPEDCLLNLELKHDGISVAVFEVSERFFYWEGEKFRSQLISD